MVHFHDHVESYRHWMSEIYNLAKPFIVQLNLQRSSRSNFRKYHQPLSLRLHAEFCESGLSPLSNKHAATATIFTTDVCSHIKGSVSSSISSHKDPLIRKVYKRSIISGSRGGLCLLIIYVNTFGWYHNQRRPTRDFDMCLISEFKIEKLLGIRVQEILRRILSFICMAKSLKSVMLLPGWKRSRTLLCIETFNFWDHLRNSGCMLEEEENTEIPEKFQNYVMFLIFVIFEQRRLVKNSTILKSTNISEVLTFTECEFGKKSAKHFAIAGRLWVQSSPFHEGSMFMSKVHQKLWKRIQVNHVNIEQEVADIFTESLVLALLNWIQRGHRWKHFNSQLDSALDCYLIV